MDKLIEEIIEPFINEDTIGHGYPNKEDMKKIKKRVNKERSRTDSDKEYQYYPINETVSSGQLNQIEKYLDRFWNKVGIDIAFTRHFLDRVNDRRNIKPISSSEVIKIFRDTYKKYGKQISNLGNEAQAVLKDIETDINVPFVLKWDGKEFDLVAKTIMRKKDFKSSNKKFAVEGVDLPIKIGDTVLMGKFKNKKVVIKTIGWNEKGDLLINGKSAMRMRIPKKPNIFDETVEEFLTTIDMETIIKEASGTGNSGADDGPSGFYGNFRSFRNRGKRQAERLGFEVIDYILTPKTKVDKNYPEYPSGPVKAVSYLPAGIGTGGTPNNQENFDGIKGYNKWIKHMKKIAQTVGMQLLDFMDVEEKEIKQQISKDSSETLKKQKEEEREKVTESSFSKVWWKKLLE